MPILIGPDAPGLATTLAANASATTAAAAVSASHRDLRMPFLPSMTEMSIVCVGDNRGLVDRTS